jgi:hypothetical protein
MYIVLRIKYPLFLSELLEILNRPHRFSKNSQISNFMKICPVGAKFYADRRTDRNDEGTSRFSQYLRRRLRMVGPYFRMQQKKYA